MNDNNATTKAPNPQGKGLVPVLAALSAASYRSVALPKQIGQIASELFTSMFVLESSFGFKPVQGRLYWLYRHNKRYKLSLLSPQQWSTAISGEVIGQCMLHEDLTWTLELSDEAVNDPEFMDYIAERRRLFGEALQKADSVDDLLPVFQQSLPFYQRVFASAMAGSLGHSMQLSGINGLSYEQAAGLLAADKSESYQ